MRQGSRAIALYNQCFERLAARIGSLRDIVGQADGDLHIATVADRRAQISAATDGAAAPVSVGSSRPPCRFLFSSAAGEWKKPQSIDVVSRAEIKKNRHGGRRYGQRILAPGLGRLKQTPDQGEIVGMTGLARRDMADDRPPQQIQ